MTETAAGLEEMERGAEIILETLGRHEKAVRDGGQMLSQEGAIAVLTVARDALRGALGLVGRFKEADRQAKRLQRLAENSTTLNRGLTEQLGQTTLAAETALGLVPPLKNRS